ncbi:chemotaxis protein CheB [Kineococcus sp. SYSU DK003]|uniref:chemotaxis protein CheB n=1 Tax=Kineococcus sp. SYSU DK003 TaxID=3383124 RepID=UPI003D7CAC91
MRTSGQEADGTDEQRFARGRGVDVVALVASAGGLGALTVVLGDLPTDLPVAVVVQQHLGGHSSQLAPILRRRTGQEVVWAEDGMPLRAGRVLVTPPGQRLEVVPDGTCRLLPDGHAARGFPHDGLLTSLAVSCGARVLGVVLTGAGRDGAAGVRALEQAGAVVLAQSEAEHPPMPQAALEAGADLSLPLDEIAVVVTRIVRGGALPGPR